jgi:hypothetical protein
VGDSLVITWLCEIDWLVGCCVAGWLGPAHVRSHEGDADETIVPCVRDRMIPRRTQLQQGEFQAKLSGTSQKFLMQMFPGLSQGEVGCRPAVPTRLRQQRATLVYPYGGGRGIWRQ